MLLEIGKIALLQFLFGKLVMFKITSSFFSFEKCHFCFLSKNVLHEANKQFSKCYICIFSLEECNFCFHLELCKLTSLPLFMMSTLEILAPPLSLSKRREDPYINFQIMTKVSINLICASLYIEIKTYTISKTLFFMHDTEKYINHH